MIYFAPGFSLSLPRASARGKEFCMVDLQQDDEIGDDQWPEDQPGDPEIIEPDNNP